MTPDDVLSVSLTAAEWKHIWLAVCDKINEDDAGEEEERVLNAFCDWYEIVTGRNV